MMKNNWGLFFLGLLLATALVVSTHLVTRALLEIKRSNQTVEVKGFAEKQIVSDWAVWRGRVTTRAADLSTASRILEQQKTAVLNFLRAAGVEEKELEVSPVMTQVLYQRDDKGRPMNQVEAYALSATFQVSASDIERVGAVAKRSEELIQKGIEFSAQSPEFFYTKFGELKIEMLAEATADARRRAEQLAEKSGSAIGPLRFARQGVFQITPVYSTEVSNFGRNDTSSREKSIKAVVTIGYAIEPR